MRDKEILEEPDYLHPVGGVGGQVVPPVDDDLTVEDQFPDEERDAGDELMVREDEGLLNPGDSPEFDHSLRRQKPENQES
ncbi:MAG: hypothetical protein R2845_01190 [Thermomicrobiales bacterium]